MVEFTYFGLDKADYTKFTTGGSIVSWTTGQNTTTYADQYEMEKDYLILTMSDGNTACMPLDLELMQETIIGYTITLDKHTTLVFTTLRKSPGKTDFVDVFADTYFEDAVVWAVDNGVTSGTDENTFSPDMFCTRGQVVTFLWRSEGKLEPTTKKNPFNDVSESDWFYKAVLWAVEKGITTGTSANTFSPNVVCSEAQTLTFIFRCLDIKNAPHSGNVYVKYKNQYFAEPLAWADRLGMLRNQNADYNPNCECTRANTVYYLYNGINSKNDDLNSVKTDNEAVGSYIDWSWSNWTPVDSNK